MRLLTLFLSLILISNLAWSQADSTKRIYDFDQLYSQSEKGKLMKQIESIEVNHSFNIYLVNTANFYPFLEVEPYLKQLFNSVSKFQQLKIIVISKDLKKTDIYTLQDGNIKKAHISIKTDYLLPALSKEHYYSGVKASLKQLSRVE